MSEEKELSVTETLDELEKETDKEAKSVITQHGYQGVFAKDMQLADIETQEKVLSKYTEGRDYFRGWLTKQFKEGVHFGFPPGCEAKTDEETGQVLVKTKSGNYAPLNPKQWQVKPSLYKAGAAFLADLLRLRAEYHTDEGAQKVVGSGVFCRTCCLFDKVTSELIGQGSGAFKIGTKGMQENAALKMADKNALTAAVLNTTAIADMFTQDIEDQPNKREHPVGADENTSNLIRDWTREGFEKGHPMYDHKPTPQELKTFRELAKIWTKGKDFESAEDVFKWLKSNCELVHTEKDGQVTGIGIVKNVKEKL